MNAMVPQAARQLFLSAYGAEPDVITSAPGRVNLIGEHTDYNGGEVLPIAISSRAFVAMRRAEEGSLSRAVSDSERSTGEFDMRNPARTGQWWDYISGAGAVSETALPQADIAVSSNVPAGAGLSSSAALEVASGFALAALVGEEPDPREVALQGWRVENRFVGVQSGIMDQFASALSRAGHALHVWCDTMDTEHVPFPGTVLIFDTAVPRSLRTSEFNTRQAECVRALELMRQSFPDLPNLAAATPEQVRAAALPEPLSLRALHVTEETRRVGALVSALRETGTLRGNLLYESHKSLRDQYQCSTPELDWFVDRAARETGVEGARLTGAGWGGCAIACGSREALAGAGEEIVQEYEQIFKRTPRVWLTEAAAGVSMELRR